MTRVLTSNAALARFDEVNDLPDLVRGREFRAHRLEALPRVVFAAVNQPERFLDRLHAFRGEVVSLETNEINPADHRGVAIRDHEWRNILHDLGATAGDREAPNPAELMH